MALARIKAICPQTKLILLVRDPIDRAISQYFHSLRLGFEHLSILDAFMAEEKRLQGSFLNIVQTGMDRQHQENSYLSRSQYEKQINQVLRHFPASQLIVFKSEDLYANPIYILEKLEYFLGVSINKNIDNSHVHKGKYHSVSILEIEKVKSYLRSKLETTYSYMESLYGITWK